MTHARHWLILLTAGMNLLCAGASQATTFTVTKTADTNDGACGTDCSLREAVIAANANPGPDHVTVPAGTYVLSIGGASEDAGATGDLDITGELALTGAGADETIIDGNGTDRVIHIVAPVTVAITALTIRNGKAGGDPSSCTGGSCPIGGGVLNDGTLTLANTNITTNTALSGGGGIGSGRVWSGGYAIAGGTLAVTNSTISGNTVLGPECCGLGTASGGGIGSIGSVTVTNSTISGNDVRDNGGGIATLGTPVTITNSTISGNSGGGVGPTGSPLTITSSTVTGNIGHGIQNTTGTIVGTIVTGNAFNCLPSNPVSGLTLVSDGHNLDDDGTCPLTHATDLPNVPGAGLGPLSDNGGPTATHALLAGSPAIDAGGNDCPLLDQRGQPRTDGNGDGVVTCDIGAFEFPLIRNLDHFKCYKAKTASGTGKFQQRTVILADQFETKNTTVVKPVSICNPVDKDGEGIEDATAHLECYKIKDVSGQSKFTPRNVTTENQFGTETLTATKADTLCVPSEKDGQPSALNLDHFKCYKARTATGAAKFQRRTVSLTDQFESKNTTVLRPVSICTPVDKNGEGIKSSLGHLECYRIKDVRGQAKFSRRDVTAKNQFDTETLTVTKSDMLCVPSLKTDTP